MECAANTEAGRAGGGLGREGTLRAQRPDPLHPPQAPRDLDWEWEQGVGDAIALY